jgi:hypothetical protein
VASAGVSRAVLRVFVVLVHSAQAPVWTSYLAAKIEYMDRPLASAEFLVIEFDHHRGTLKVVDDYTYSASEEVGVKPVVGPRRQPAKRPQRVETAPSPSSASPPRRSIQLDSHGAPPPHPRPQLRDSRGRDHSLTSSPEGLAPNL